MVEPSGHCPYLGLKQNQAIRFASPTPEHRCYAAGQAQDIPQIEPDYQVRYCLSASHVRCPLYMGMPLPTTSTPLAATAPAGAAPAALAPVSVSPASGLRAWFADLAPRDRVIYSVLLAVLLLALFGYALGGLAFVGAMLNPTAAPTATGPTLALPPTVTTTMPSLTATEFASPTATLSSTVAASPTAPLLLSPTATPYELIPVTNTPTIPIIIPPPPVFFTATPTLSPELPPIELPAATPDIPPAEIPTMLPTEVPTEVPTPTATP
ncbi:hypothetical protein [uncultured Chloroflexus sp.]|uniref:hypothetical protein n=2 Tax=uncultured Chloroflexus sp. TaxID=214040 RepID=UPI002636E0F3|nr:hypothetical protein [uncultured Chloroflexus sp.]